MAVIVKISQRVVELATTGTNNRLVIFLILLPWEL